MRKIVFFVGLASVLASVLIHTGPRAQEIRTARLRLCFDAGQAQGRADILDIYMPGSQVVTEGKALAQKVFAEDCQ